MSKMRWVLKNEEDFAGWAAVDSGPLLSGGAEIGVCPVSELDAAVRMAVNEAWWGKYPDDTAEHASTLREAIVAKVMREMAS